MTDLSAEELGFDRARLDRIGEVVSRDIEQEMYDGAVLCVSRGGVTAMLEAFGYADRASGTAMEADRLFISLSMAKQLTGVVALNRVERGDLSLTMKVAEVIPEFGCRGKEHITLYQLLTHTAGLQL
ncbi:MAG: beta-lactamase family protein, partial [Gammaproteobacteria bacterium]|nr:beta-lactamase family protein [Gammaproteobacteria bacterium]